MSVLHDMASGWWDWIAPVSLQVALLAVVAIAADGLLRKTTWSSLRSALWWMVLLRCFLPARLPSPFGRDAGWVPTSLTEIPLLGSATGAAGAEPSDPFVGTCLFVAWLVVAIALSVAGLRRAFSARRALRRYSRPASSSLGEAAARIAGRLRLRRVPAVRVGGAVPSPLVCGALRPTIYLPTEDLEDLEHVLLHELAHVRRRDPLQAAIAVAIQSILWFHPAVWIARTRLSVLRELACDATVASVLEDETPEYRHALLRHACRAHGLLDGPGPRPVLGELGFLGKGSRIVRRLEMLERPTLGRGLQRRRRISTTLAILAALALFPAAPREGVTIDDLEAFVADEKSPAGCLHHRYAILKKLYESEDASK